MIIVVLFVEIVLRFCKFLLLYCGRFCDKWYLVVVEVIFEGNSIYDRYVDKLGIFFDVFDVSEIFVKDLEKYMYILEIKLVWLLFLIDFFICILYYNVS